MALPRYSSLFASNSKTSGLYLLHRLAFWYAFNAFFMVQMFFIRPVILFINNAYATLPSLSLLFGFAVLSSPGLHGTG